MLSNLIGMEQALEEITKCCRMQTSGPKCMLNNFQEVANFKNLRRNMNYKLAERVLETQIIEDLKW
jgi:hypothetical protein